MGLKRTSEMENGGILVSAAVEGEMEGIREHLTAASTCRAGGQALTGGRLGGQGARLVVTGPGIANTVHGLSVAVADEKPELIVQMGCGGGFEQAGLVIGDVVIASREIDAQLGLEKELAGAAVGRLPFPVIARSGKEIFNCYPVDRGEIERASKILITGFAKSGVSVMTGPFITVATVTASLGRAGDLHRLHGAMVENMEGAGAAHVAALYDIPFMEIRVVSNMVGVRDKSKWDLPLAFQRCAQAVRLYLESRRL